MYFIFLFWVTKPEKQEKAATGAAEAVTEAGAGAGAEAGETLAPSATSPPPPPPPLGVTKESISYSLTAACALCLGGELLSKVAFGGRVSAM